MLECKGLINKCVLKVAILYSYYLFINTIFYLADCSFNGCQKYFYENVQGELKATKQLLYREAVDGVLSSLHYIKGVLGEDTCLPGGVNALSRLFNQKYVFEGIFNLIRAFLA